jgi:hypothetical protein
MRKKIIVITVIAAAITAGCGGSSLPTDETGAPQLSAVANSIGCMHLKPMSQPTMFASAEGNCKLHGRDIDLVTFATDKLRDNWEKVADNFGAKIKDGPGWAAYRG